MENINELASRALGDGRILIVLPLTFGRARLHIGPENEPFFDDGW